MSWCGFLTCDGPPEIAADRDDYEARWLAECRANGAARRLLERWSAALSLSQARDIGAHELLRDTRALLRVAP